MRSSLTRDEYYGSDDETRAGPRAKVRTTQNAANMIELLDNRQDMLAALGLVLTYPNKREVDIEGPARSIARIAEYIGDRDADGWDQPASWKTSARKSKQSIVKQLYTQGFDSEGFAL